MTLLFNIADTTITEWTELDEPLRYELRRMFWKHNAPMQLYRVEVRDPKTAKERKAQVPYCVNGRLVLPLRIQHAKQARAHPVLVVVEPREGALVENLAMLFTPAFDGRSPLVQLAKPKPTLPKMRVKSGCGTVWASCREVAKFLRRLHDIYGENPFPAKEVVELLESDAPYSKITALWGRVRALELGKWIRREHEGKRYSPYLLTPTAGELVLHECNVRITTRPWPKHE